MLLIVIAAIVVRCVLLPTAGYPHDIRDFSGWMFALVHVGFHGIYSDTTGKSFTPVDYSPGYLYVLSILGTAYTALFHGTNDPVLIRAWLKVPAAIADFGTALGVVQLAKLSVPRLHRSRILAVLLLTPVMWLVSAYWGQVDSVAATAFVWTLVMATERRFILMWILFAVSVLLKPQPVVAAPLMFVFAAMFDRRKINLIVGPICALVTAYLAALPFAPSTAPLPVLHWLFERYVFGIGKFPYATTGAFNLYAIIGHFGQLDSITHLGISLHTMGLALFAIASIALFVRAIQAWRVRSGDAPEDRLEQNRTLIFASALVIASMYFLTTRMHERYLFCALVFLPLFAHYGKRARYAVWVIFSVFTINLIAALLNPEGSDVHGKAMALIHVLSLFSVAAYGTLMVVFLNVPLPFGVSKRLETDSIKPHQSSITQAPLSIGASLRTTLERLPNQGFIVAIVAAVICLLTGGRQHTPADNYVYLADAFLHGHIAINWPGERIDALPWHGKYYVIEAPIPALLLMPAVALFGMHTNQTLLGVAFVALSIGVAWNILERLSIGFITRCWLTAFLFAGTDLWWCGTLGGVWLIAHLGAFTATILALREMLGRRRSWLIALYGCLAVGCRFSLILALPVYAAILALGIHLQATATHAEPEAAPRGRQLVNILLPYCAVVAIGMGAWVWYNEIRWHTINDIGYNAWYNYDSFGGKGSPFGLRFFNYEFFSFFFSLPHLVNVAPWIVPTVTGQGLPFTSPALLLALFAQGNRKLIILLWVAVALVAGPSFIYYANGFDQFGMRHALDFEPFLFMLMALAATRGLAVWAKALCAYSIIVGVWGVYCWHHIPRWV